MIFDTHVHYDDRAFETDRAKVLSRLHEEGVGMLADIGADITSSKKAIALSRQYDFVYAVVGVHPSESGEMTEADIDCLREMAGQPKVVAIGEIGLDYHYEEPPREIQKKWFAAQLALAGELRLPVSIHSREAAQDTLTLIKEADMRENGGVIHCFSYGWEMAKIYLDMGFYLGIGGVVTFKNAKKLKEVVQKAPLEQLVLETDAPYLAPEPFRGKRNTSPYLKYVAEEIAGLKGITAEEVISATEQNACRLYRIMEG